MRCHVYPDFSRKHFRGVAACRRALMGMARYNDGFSRPCLCYPAGGAGKTGSDEDDGCICSQLSSEISVSNAKDSNKDINKRLSGYWEH
ncbi:MAG: hypothetical protein K2J90_05580 [Lachnospiraceae bacterium]|nr:hypothetical protein [Lachnospiraceae bacterium]